MSHLLRPILLTAAVSALAAVGFAQLTPGDPPPENDYVESECADTSPGSNQRPLVCRGRPCTTFSEPRECLMGVKFPVGSVEAIRYNRCREDSSLNTYCEMPPMNEAPGQNCKRIFYYESSLDCDNDDYMCNLVVQVRACTTEDIP